MIKTYKMAALTFCLCCSLSSIPLLAMGEETEGGAEPQAKAAQEEGVVSGKVLETMNAGGYTYLKVDRGESQEWVAIPEASVKVGDEVSYYDGMVMRNFPSKTLNRTFDAVVFSPGLVGQAGGHGGGMESFHQGVPGMGSGMGMGGATVPKDVKVGKAEGENAFTIEEIYAKRDELNGKTVRIHGTVVKYNPSIMGRNWLHIQDGSGSDAAGNNDLAVTTNQTTETGKEVTVEGKAMANKDFGSGYSYTVIIEEATLAQ